MNDKLREEQIALEEECRNATVNKFHEVHEREGKADRYAETSTGKFLIKSYLRRYSEAISQSLEEANNGKKGPNVTSFRLLKGVDIDVVAFLFLKAIINRVPTPMTHKKQPCTVTSLAVFGAGLIHDELRIQHFENNWRNLARKLFKDFDERELPRYKRKELIRRQFNNLKIDWAIWSKSDMLKLGTKLLEIFKNLTGDVIITPYKLGKHSTSIVVATPSLADLIRRRVSVTEALYSTYYPMVIPPRDWSNESLERGGYLTHNVSPYSIVKNSKRAYRSKLDCADFPEVIESLNALQRTPWRINVAVLEVFETLFERKEEVAGLPSCDEIPVPPRPNNLEPDDRESDLSKEYRKACYLVHEQNRRDVSKRANIGRIFQLSRRFARYEEIFFPHSLCSRSRAYPIPALLNPQGPDLAKGVLEFANGKEIAQESDACALAFHGANCFGFDKGSLQERVDWVVENEESIFETARDPLGSSWWLDADSPAQFLAFCLEWEEFIRTGYGFVSHLHCDVDATCSGLQHFAAALRDPMGKFVNMTPSDKREDVYQECADAAMAKFNKETSEKRDLAQAWLKFKMDRGIAKRPVMIIGYSGTFHACLRYVEEAVRKRLKNGEPIPWHGDLIDFVSYGASILWPSISSVVPSTVETMQWLKAIAIAIAKTNNKDKVEWVTPLGFPVEQFKSKMKSVRVLTHLDGSIFTPRLNEDTDTPDPRAMGNSVPPSFVHSLDASHMHKTVARAKKEGLNYFAAVHDSFGVHAADLWRFNEIIRETFVEIYEEHDVLEEFYAMNIGKISDKNKAKIPEKPLKGTLDIKGVLESDYFFS